MNSKMACPLLALSIWFIIFPASSLSTTHQHPPPRINGAPPHMLVYDPDGGPPHASSDFETFYYHQTLDHFNYNPESYAKFNQKYMVNSKHWGGSGSPYMAPIFAYLGDEEPLNPGFNFITDIADEFRALVVFIEHRFYGDSIPFGLKMEEVVTNASVRGYFNSAQALADYAEVILHVKKKVNAHHSPVVVFGGSYGGMLAAWFRLKYPHVAVGALASSAPILYFDNITSQDGYYSIVTKDFRETSESCYETIKESWAEINKVASETDGLSTLRKKFKICSKLSDASELKNYLIEKYAAAAQYGRPPVYKATAICNAINAVQTTDILERIFAGLKAYYGADKSCYNTSESVGTQTSLGWSWQTCSDMGMPIGIGSNSSMFEPQPFNWSDYITSCKLQYRVLPRPHWITTYYGGHDIKLVLERFGSNIIFSNGLKDPYSSAGVLKNISETLIAIKTNKGSHCMDILKANASTDPEWLVNQRKKEVKVIKEWIKHYYLELTKSLLILL